jgi:hypothetical protein
MRALVPAYFYPGGKGLKYWDELLAAAGNVPVTAIANPNDGPGAASDPNYADIIARASAAGVKVIGYVATGYGQKDPGVVRAEVDRWVNFYPAIGGFFFDEQSSGDAEVSLYADYFSYARGKVKDGLIVGNPGRPPSERYLSAARADIECIFESDKGFAQFTPPAWIKNYTQARLCALLLSVSGTDSMKKGVHRAAELGIGNVYVTDDKLPNPWDRLPKYWEKEVHSLRDLAH